MHILFAHDVPLKKDLSTNDVYSVTFDYSLWKRYLSFANHLTVAARMIELNTLEKDNYKLSSGEGVEFVKVPSVTNPLLRLKNKKTANKVISDRLEKTDGVVVRLPSEIGLITYKIAKKKNIPVAIEMVGCPQDSYWYHGSLLGKIYSPIAKVKYSKVLKDSKYTLYVTKDYLQKKYPTTGYQESASNVNLRTSEKNNYLEKVYKKDKIVLGIIGSLDVKYKGFKTAFQSLKLLRERIPNAEIKLEIVGGGNIRNWKSTVKKLGIDDAVVFKGRLASPMVKSWMCGLDFYLQPSKTEGLPRAVLEAMNEGIPVIASDVGGLKELLNHKFLHKPKDYKQLVDKVVELHTDENLRIEQSEFNFCKAKEYNKKSLTDRINSFYNQFSISIQKGEIDEV